MINFHNTYADLPSEFFDPIKGPNSFKPTLIAFNQDLAHRLGLKFENVSDDTLAKYFSAAQFIDGSTPIAMAYAAHQFGHWVPQLGDGRAMLLGEFLAPGGERYDVHLKGSGQTKYSRRGDGKSALGPVIREYIISESMAALNVPTMRTLCAVRTHEVVYRETEKPGAVLTRIGKSHVRVGTFQFFAMSGDVKNLKILADYTMKRLYPETKNYLEFWRMVAMKQVHLIAQWMSFGFIHGVMNTDNMAISGESIDYGPCAFMDEFKFNKVFSSIDREGRYAYSNQPRIALWNLARLAECLLPLMDSPEEAKTLFENGLGEFNQVFMDTHFKLMSNKLGGVKDQALLKDWLQLLEVNELDFTLSFIDLERLSEGRKSFTGLEDVAGFQHFFEAWQKQKPDLSIMKIHNPLTIARNHMVERAISQSDHGHDEEFFEMVAAVKNPFERKDELSLYDLPPKIEERVLKTFCGT
jgi:uncharacterized protein YdiU (UPF0061 family)